MDVTQFILAGVALTAGAALQGAVGFGMGLFAIPLLLWIGLEMPIAVAAVVACAIAQNASNSFQYRRHIPWRETLTVSLFRFISMPLGVLALGLLAEAGKATAKQVAGVAIIVILIARRVLKVHPVERLWPGWAVFAGGISGAMSGGLGMGGPPLVLWTMAHDWPGRKSRAFLWTCFVMLMPFQAIAMWARFGNRIPLTMGLCLIYVPLLILGSQAGMKLGERLSRKRLRAAAFWLLVITGLGAIIEPLLRRSG